MKVVIAMDSFKGSMSSLEAGEAARRGVLRAGEAEVVVLPLADGGEGTTEALAAGLGGAFRTVTVHGPLGEPVQARYGVLPDGRTAVMEMAQAAGITLVREKDPWRANTAGVGEMILDAVKAGCRDFLLGIGGSATTEGGLGMLDVLGWGFYDAQGRRLSPAPASLGQVESIRREGVPALLEECRFRIACDVTNPLCGPQGAVAVYGPQKGVRPQEIAGLDEAMARYARAVERCTGRACADLPGAGAAGGLGFAFLSFFPGAVLEPGVDLVLDAVGMDKALEGAQVVVTGEGRLDGQTASGKAPLGVARLAKGHGCRVVAFAGSVTPDAGACHQAGIDGFFPIVRGPGTLEEAMDPAHAQSNLEQAVEQVFRLLMG